MLKVTVKSASNLPDVDRLGGKSDPYAIVSFQGKDEKTDVVKDNLNPEWNKEIRFDLSGRALSSQDLLEVQVKDWEKILIHKLLGKAAVPLGALLKTKTKDSSVALVTGDGKPTLGKLQLSIEYSAPEGSKADEGQSSGDGDNEDNLEAGEEEEDEENETGGERKMAKKRRKRKKRLSDKPQDFQVRVKIFKARQLPGNNVNPMVTVNVADQEQSTLSRKSTNKPEYNESFSFHFHESPAELFEKLIVFEVINDRSGLRKDTLMGYFECDIASVYDRDGHAIIRKWALLSDADDEDEDDEPKEDNQETKKRIQRSGRGAPAGYIKITVIVLGPGDEPPPLEKLGGADDTDDVQSNLLCQSGVTLQPALFSLKVFCAKDLPQMDTAAMQGIKKFFGVQKDDEKLCDPYVVVSFSGDQSKSKTLYKTTEPEFKQTLNIPFRFPSMCERLKLQMFDWDRLSEDDCIATSHLSIPNISGDGDKGFLPMFGPAWINFYGSPREFSELSNEYEKLNFDVGEGVAYRGRLLVELQTTLVGEVEKDKPLVTDLPNQEIIRFQPYLSVTKYKLFACFYEASMVSEEDGPVEFEISIGNYGNMLDESMAPSNTPPCNAVFDGSYYYYLPWTNEKPCVCVESYWENIMFRLEPLNIIRNICRRLTMNITKVRAILQTKAPDKDQVSVLFSLLDQLISDCSTGIPDLKGRKNKLDRKLESRRRKELHHIANEASELKDKATDVQTALDNIQGYLERLQDLAIEPQNSIPDVIIWMLSGSNRIAYYRIPACDLLYSTNSDACGYLCGKPTEIILKYPGEKARDVKDHPELPAKVRMELWFGLEKNETAWSARPRTEGSFSLYAETYENQIKAVLVWTSTGCPRPDYSDASGDLPLPKDKFKPPVGWQLDGKWYISPELSLISSHQEAGVKTFLDDVFENESRLIPGGTFGAASVPWTDVHGDKSEAKNDIACPAGWEWTGDWLVDTNRPVDSDGWEYTVDFSYGIYSSTPKAYHLARRRRWVRSRELRNPEAITKNKEDLKEFTKEGWEYAPMFGIKSHIKERKLDFVRRRRWHCKLVRDKRDDLPVTMPPVLQLDMKNKEGCICCLPRMFMTFPKPHRYQLWVYIYQARDLLAFDDSGMNDPYARVVFHDQSQVTEVKEKTLCPTWDQTLVFEHVDIYESVESVVQSPPTVVVELFDKDPIDKDDYMGRCIISPTVRVQGHQLPEPRLVWHTLMFGDEPGGQLLAACELFLDEGEELPFPPPKNEKDVFMVRDGVRPILQRSAIEILCWGVRNMKKYELTSVSSPLVEFECNGHLCVSEAIKNAKKNPNFSNPVLPRMIVNLPVEEDYAPPINIKVRDNRTFGRKPVVGVHSIKSLTPYRCELPSIPEPLPAPSKVAGKSQKISGKEGSHVVDVTSQVKPKKPKDGTLDWWSKYYASIGDLDKAGPEYLAKGYETLIVYQTELEKVPQFQGFKDFMFTFPLSRGRVTCEEKESKCEVGELKGTFRIYTLPEDGSTTSLPKTLFTGLPPAEPVDCTVRVYVVKAIDLQPRDPSGSTDSYLTVTLGKTKISDKENYIPNNTSPSYGKMFELKAKIPLAKDLKVTVMDRDLFSRDDVVGETVIDLENRLLSRYRATCSLSQNYCTSGINKWRDTKKPKTLLEEWCANNNKSPPEYRDDNTLVLDGTIHSLEEYEENIVLHGHLGNPQQRLALYVLNQLPLVPEHVETRPLYNKKQPNMQQGRIQLWVDIFPHIHGKVSLSPPVNIAPRVPTSYILRVIIWNTADVILQETSITGEKMSDIYVKSWLSGEEDDKQETDTHYRSLNGEGNFNWRFVFPFEFLAHEKKLIICKKESIFSVDETKLKVAPQLNVQVWDADILTDDFLGTTSLNLNKLPRPAKCSSKCNLIEENQVETIDLFQQKSCYGWWPVTANMDDGTSYLSGKVEMTMEVLTKVEADLKPAGKARDDPNKNPTLEEPKRPATSFLWFTSPLKTLRYIIWGRYKWYILGFLILLLVILAIALFVYNLPGYTAKKLLQV